MKKHLALFVLVGIALFTAPRVSLGEELGAPVAGPVLAVEFEARALIQSISEVTLSSEISGRVDNLPHLEGDRFAKGDTLIRFGCQIYQARLKIAKATYKAGGLTLDTMRKRSAMGSVGALEVGIAEAEFDKAGGQVAAAQFPVSRCHIRAPFDGRVVQLAAHRYETVAVGDPLMRILDDKNLEVKVIVPSLWLSWLGPKTAFEITVDETGEVLRGHLKRLGALVDAVGQSIPVFGKLDVPSARLISGMSGSVRFLPNLGKDGSP